MGDFNYKEIDYNSHTVHADTDSDAYKFFITTQDLFLIQHITEDTRKRDGTTASVLDYVFTDEDRIIEELNYEVPIGNSDHVCLTWNYIVNIEDTSTDRHALNYWKGNYVQINRDMSAIDWVTELAGKNTEDAWITFRHLLKNSVVENVPAKKLTRN